MPEYGCRFSSIQVETSSSIGNYDEKAQIYHLCAPDAEIHAS